MKNTISMKENRDFRRLFRRGYSTAEKFLAVYYSKNRLGYNRLGLTVGVKLGNAVTRNRIKRLIREAYRLHETEFTQGIDIIVVARTRAVRGTLKNIEKSLLQCAYKLKIAEKSESTVKNS